MSRETETDQPDDKDVVQPEAADKAAAEEVNEEAEQELLEEEQQSGDDQIEQLEQQVARLMTMYCEFRLRCRACVAARVDVEMPKFALDKFSADLLP